MTEPDVATPDERRQTWSFLGAVIACFVATTILVLTMRAGLNQALAVVLFMAVFAGLLALDQWRVNRG